MPLRNYLPLRIATLFSSLSLGPALHAQSPAPPTAPEALAAPADPAPAAAVEVTQPEAPKIPNDVYWVSRRVSVPIEGGLIGLEAGAEVRVVKQEGSKWVAVNEKGMFEIDSYLLMKDPVAAALLRSAEAQSSAAARAAAAAATRAAEAAELQRRLQQEAATSASTPPARSLTGESRLNEPAKRN